MPVTPTAKGKRPQQFGKFRISARIATGGMGAVYKAFDTRREREVALKVLAPEMAERPILRRRFQLEASHGQRLPPHENVVTLYEAGAVHGFQYLSLELVEGIDLKEYVARNGKFDIEKSRPLIVQAARAIAHLHQSGITHRDVKPSNFLLTARASSPIIKLIDLGLARHVDEDDEDQPRPPGSTLGTIDYLAPEQARNCAAADVRSDLYALGCTWFHLLAGAPPFTGGTPTERVHRHAEAPLPDIRHWNPKISLFMVQVLQRLLAKDPADRYQTPAALICDLEGEEPATFLEKDLDAALALPG